MTEKTLALVKNLPFHEMRVLEISGNAWCDFGFKSHTSVQFPQFDICERTLSERFDLIIAEQVLEHVLWPYRAASNVHDLLVPGGYFLVSTPFLIKVHNFPTDCSRWTETGLKYLLAECGFPLESTVTGSWGNTDCVIANFSGWVPYQQGAQSLENEPDMPYHVWALAQKPSVAQNIPHFRTSQNMSKENIVRTTRSD